MNSAFRLVSRLAALALTAVAVSACGARQEEQPPTPTATPWPTLAPVPTAEITAIPGLATPVSNEPELVEQFRVNLEQGLAAVYPIAGDIERPTRIEVIVLEGAPDPAISINDAVGNNIAVIDNGGTGEAEVIGQFLFPGSGYYELGLSSAAGSGQVGVSIYRLAAADIEGGGVFASTEQTLSGSIEHPSTYHTFRLPLERGQRVDLAAVAQEDTLDLVFELYSPDGVLLAQRDDQLGVDPYLWNFMPRQTGIYTLVLTNFGGTTGPYSLRVTPSESAGEAVIGSRAEAAVQGVPRRSTWITVAGEQYDGISVSARPVDPGIDLLVSVIDPFGNALATASLTGTGEQEVLSLVQFPVDGPYQVEFTTLGDSGAIEYLVRRVRLADLEMGGRVTPARIKHEGTIEGPGSIVVYGFDGTPGDVIGANATVVGPGGLDLAFDLYDPDGIYLFTRDNTVGQAPVIDRYQLLKEGRYWLVVRSVGEGTGEFEFFLTDQDAPDLLDP